jgi:hypothetical protein
MVRSEFVVSYLLDTPPSFREKANQQLLMESESSAGTINQETERHKSFPAMCAGCERALTSPVRRHILAEIC